MATPTAQQYLSVLRTYLGVTESPLGSNRTRVGVEYGWNGVPWCAQTVSVALRRSGLTNWWSASTDQMEAWARAGRNGARWISRLSTPRPGDIAVWDWKRDGTANHVSTIESVRADGMLITIGGNESNRCQRAVRSKSGLRGYIRLPFRIPVTTAPKPPTTNVVHPTLRLGSTGAAVKELQTKLNKVVGSRLVVDGQFGEKTKTAVINLQRFFKLVADGIVGPKTWGILDYTYAMKMAGA
jgi:hypothetical protein